MWQKGKISLNVTVKHDLQIHNLSYEHQDMQTVCILSNTEFQKLWEWLTEADDAEKQLAACHLGPDKFWPLLHKRMGCLGWLRHWSCLAVTNQSGGTVSCFWVTYRDSGARWIGSIARRWEGSQRPPSALSSKRKIWMLCKLQQHRQ